MLSVGLSAEIGADFRPQYHIKRGIEHMDIRYSANQRDVKRYTTEELRNEFLI